MSNINPCDINTVMDIPLPLKTCTQDLVQISLKGEKTVYNIIHFTMKFFAEEAYQWATHKASKNESSCWYTSLVLDQLYHTPKKLEFIRQILLLRLNSSLPVGNIKILDLFLGKALSEMALNYKEDLSSFSKKFSAKCIQVCDEFHHTVTDFTETFWNNCPYDFNRDTFNNLRKKMIEDRLVLKNEESYIYKLYARYRLPTSLLCHYFHAFDLEMFLDNGEVKYRLYNSWVNQFTLLEDLERRISQGKDTFNQLDFDIFLEQFEKIVCRSKLRRKTKTINPLFVEACFNVKPLDPPPFTHYYEDCKELIGLTFFYLPAKVTPNKVFKNLCAKIEGDLLLQNKLALIAYNQK